MGLSGVKKRSKLSKDPNNTTWSRDTTNFGHKILSKQGWKPGDFLGAENANHSEHYTAANASHIRVMLREDNLGLGAQVGKGNAETFGLSMFSGLLGRLNGKSEEEVQKKQDHLRDAELRAYQANKYGFMNFVYGGLLVGDKMEEVKKLADMDTEPSRKRKADDVEDAEDANIEKKKRKSESKATLEASGDSESGAKPKKSKKSKQEKEDAEKPAEEANSSSESSEEDKAKEDKRRKKEKRRAEKQAKSGKSSTGDDEKARLKEEKRARKEERRKREEEKRRKRAAKEAERSKEATQTSASTSENEGTATPPIVNAGLPMTGGRHAVRQRYIMQKRMASMNATALKEIFMLQPQPAS